MKLLNQSLKRTADADELAYHTPELGKNTEYLRVFGKFSPVGNFNSCK